MKTTPLLTLALLPSLLAAPLQSPQLYRQALQKLEQSDVRGALQDFQALLQQSGREEFHYYLAHCRLKLGEYEKALDHFRQAAPVQKDSWQLELGMGRTLFHLDRLKEAEKHLAAAKRLNAESIEASYHLGLIRVRQGRFESALPFFQFVAQRDPYHLGAAYNLGNSYARLRNAEQAQRWMQRHTDLSAKLDEIESLRKAASFPSSTAENWISLGDAYLGIEDFRQANQAYLKAFQMAESPQLHYHLGFTSYKMGRLQEAIQHYESFLRFHADHAEALFNLGLAFKKAGKTEDASDAFQKAVRAKPDDPLLRVPGVEILLESRQWEQALQAAVQMVNEYPRFAHGHYLQAYSLYHLGRLQEALSSLGQASSLDPAREDYRQLAVRIQQRLENPKEGQRDP